MEFFYLFFINFFNDYISRKGLPLRTIKNANVVYLLVSVLELFAPTLVAGLTPSRTEISRGLTLYTRTIVFWYYFIFSFLLFIGLAQIIN